MPPGQPTPFATEAALVRPDAYSCDVAARRVRRLSVGDNIEALTLLESGSVALVYLDPPFKSGRSYDLVDAMRGNRQGGRTPAFDDQWTSPPGLALDRADELDGLVPRPVSELVHMLTRTLGRRSLSTYLVAMAPRLVEMHRVLNDTGSLYLHCDYSASPYLRVLLDTIFGPANFRNEIIWRRTHAHSSSKRFGPVHDTILFYAKSAKYQWTSQYSDYPSHYLDTYYTHEDERDRYQLITCTAPGDRTGTRAHYRWKGQLPPPGRHWAWQKEKMEALDREGLLVHSASGVPRRKRYVDEAPGVQLQDVWSDINRLDAHSEERVGFETQKPLALIARIIAASSKPGDVILDPFAGSGTTLVAAEQAGRGWIGFDSSLLAGSISLARVRQEVNLWRVDLNGFPSDRGAALSLLRREPLAYGLWGTSMLATLADRSGRTEALVTGSGRVRIGRRLTHLESWVPLRGRRLPSAEVCTTPSRHHPRAGFVLRTGRDVGSGLAEHLRSAHGIPVADVPIESLVGEDCRKRGMAPEVAALGGG